jgi:hypothetical protein
MRYGIVTLSAPGMTSTKAPQSQPRPAQKTVLLHRFEEVDRTSRFKTASGARPAQKRQHGRNEHLITANQKTHEQEHQGARIEARSARRNHSSFSAEYEACTAAGRAITTNQKPSRNLPCWVRTMSRSRRRTRFRTTAPPILFEVTKPTRNNPCSCAARTPKTMARPRWAVPSDLTRANSTGRTKRFAFEKDKPGEAGVGIHATIPQPRQSRHPRPALVCPFSSTTGLGSTTPVQQKSSRRNAAGRLRLKPEKKATGSDSKSSS